MNHEDRNEAREMLNDILSGHLQKIEGQYRVIQSQLSSIEIQTTRTNGRVTELESKVDKVEKDIITHPINCNQVGEIKKIREDLEEYRFFKKYPKVFIGIILVAAVITWYGFRQLNKKTDKVLSTQENQGIPFVVNKRNEFIALPDSTFIRYFGNDTLYYMIIKK